MSSLEELKAREKLLAAEIEAKTQELKSVKLQINSATWTPISWTDLEQLLKTDYAGGIDYRRNPQVTANQDPYYATYCHINMRGELVVGGYYHNDRFPRGCDLFIHRERKSWS